MFSLVASSTNKNVVLLVSLFLISVLWTNKITVLASAPGPGPKKIVIGVDGGTESIRACCFDAVTGSVIGTSCAVSYQTYHPQPGWAEQNPADWYKNLGEAVRGAVSSVPGNPKDYEFCSLCADTTCCSVVVLDENKEPLRNCLLWMDARSAPQTEEIMTKCKGDPALRVNCGGEGPLSAEWMIPKALWIRQNEPEVWAKAATICEYQDFINLKLTGQLSASSCNAASRWHWDGEQCIISATANNPYPGRPLSLYQKLGIPELADKLPQLCLPMGATVGTLTHEAASHLGLPSGLPVTQGGADAFVGMIGLGCIHPGQMCLITGSSHLHCVVSSVPASSKGVWGAYRGAPLPGINFAEGGQSSTGSIMRWARSIFGATEVDYSELDALAAKISPGCDGLVAVETFQGSRTPITDPMARGALVGLTLSHTRAHIWRAFMESVCFGTRACVDALEVAGHKCDEIVMAGGTTRSHLWLQMHADVAEKPVVVCENTDAPLLGCAILASVCSGVHGSVYDAVKSMVRTHKRLEPANEISTSYNTLYSQIYSKAGAGVRPVAHAIASYRGGYTDKPANSQKENFEIQSPVRRTTISPSLLAADWSNMHAEVQKCLDAGLNRLHVDVFDGVFLDSPYALTFGPKMVVAIRKCSKDTILDLHMCVDRPARYVVPMKDAGATSFIFQWEATEDVVEAIQLAQEIVDAGMQCGVSINPDTSLKDIHPLLKTGLVSIVDVLAVQPGFGGQTFRGSAVDKIESLRNFRKSEAISFAIMVDGGINQHTASKTSADILVVGSFLFQHPESIRSGSHAISMAISSSARTEPNS